MPGGPAGGAAATRASDGRALAASRGDAGAPLAGLVGVGPVGPEHPASEKTTKLATSRIAAERSSDYLPRASEVWCATAAHSIRCGVASPSATIAVDNGTRIER